MDLKDKKCIPCESWVPPLTSEQKDQFMDRLGRGWKFTNDKTRIEKNFTFKNFKRALEFTNEVGRISEEEKHHPEIGLGWGHCKIEIWTHTNHNLFENDFILAAKIEEAFAKLYPAS